jgi:hypothetical protein
LAHVGDRGHEGTGVERSFVITTTGEAREAFVLQNQSDRHRAASNVVPGQGATDVIEGKVWLAEGDDAFAGLVWLGRRTRTLLWWAEEEALGMGAEAMDQDAEGGRRVAEAAGGCSGG